MSAILTQSRLLARVRSLFVVTLVFSIFTNLLMLTGPLFMLQVYDRVLASRSQETLVALFGLVAVLYFFYWLLEYARGRVISRVGARIEEVLKAPVFQVLLDRNVGRLSVNGGSLRDLEATRNLFTSPVILALFDMPWTPVFLGAIFLFHPMLGWLALFGGLVLVMAAVLNQILTSEKQSEAVRQAACANRFFQQVEDAASYVVGQGMGHAALNRWSGLHDKAADQSIRASDWTGAFSAFSRAFRLFLQSAILAAGAWFVLQGELSAGAMIATSILMGRALAPIDAGVGQWPVVQRARIGWKAIKILLSAKRICEPDTVLPAPKADFEVKDVTLYLKRGENPILRQISFVLRPGEALGVIGRSGSGKSTLAQVLMGIRTPSLGEVRLSGATLAQYGSERLGHFMGYLPQEVRFFDGTVAENISRMSEPQNYEKIVTAAQKARVHEIILALPDGYDTQIGGPDFSLSGGQKQRLGLARALYGNPVVVVLDEPNSALDSEGSEALNQAVQDIKQEGGVVLIMTHRPTALSTCDTLLVLDGGRVKAYGQRDDVLQRMTRNAGDVTRVIQGGRR